MSKLDYGRAVVAKARLAKQAGPLYQQTELADPDRGTSIIDRRINQVAEFIGIAMLAIIAILVFANAIGRYLLNSPLIWADEIVISFLPWLAMTGIFLSVRRRQFMRPGNYAPQLPEIVRISIDLFIHVLSAATFVLLAFYSLQSLLGSDLTTYIRIPTGWFTSAMIVGAAGVALTVVINAWQERRSRPRVSGARAE